MWFITVMEKLEPDEVGWPDFGCTRTPGYYECYEDCKHAIINNVCDIWEYCYDFAVMEHYHPGVYPYVDHREWFKFDREAWKYLPIPEPEFCKHIGNIAIG